MSMALTEYAVESSLFNSLKELKWVSRIGLGAIITGEVIRKTAMITARHAFTHNVKVMRREEHILVTHGIYKYMRHPGYVGWLIWAVGTQLLLVNPVCTVMFTYVVWKFFRERIQIEETYLRTFFGSYAEYAKQVHSGLPFIP